MKKVFVHDGVVVGISWAMDKNVAVTPAEKAASALEVDMAMPVEIGWMPVAGKNGLEFQPPPPPPPTVGPNEFHFLWTMAEQVAIEQIRQEDPVVKLFMRRLDDPRTTEVVLADPAVQAAIRHTVAQLVAKGVVDQAEADDRAAAIIAGPRK